MNAETKKVPFSLAVKTKLTKAVIKFEKDVPVYVKIVGAMHAGKQIKGTGDKQSMEPATLCDVVNLESGEEMQLIVSTLVKSILDDNYPGDTYVGKGFQITKHNKREGKRYFDYSVDEVSLPEDKATPPAATHKR